MVDICCNSIFGNSLDKYKQFTTFKEITGYTEEQKKEEEYQEKYEEENKDKFIPSIISLDLLKQGTLSNVVDFMNFIESKKIEEKSSLVLSDYDFETEDPSIIDIAVFLYSFKI